MHPIRAIRAAIAGAAALLALAACSPTYDWREAGFDDAGLLALLPCKPDRAQKPVTLPGAAEAPLRMMGCEAGGATFTIAYLHLDAAGEAAAPTAALAQWQGATEARLNAKASNSTPFAPQGAAVLPGSVMLNIESRDADGKPLHVRLASFMRRAGPQRTGLDLFQAAIYRSGGSAAKESRSAAEAADNFFSGLRLR